MIAREGFGGLSIEIKLTHEPDAVYATCDTLPGFYVSDRDEASVLAVVPEAIRIWNSADLASVREVTAPRD